MARPNVPDAPVMMATCPASGESLCKVVSDAMLVKRFGSKVWTQVVDPVSLVARFAPCTFVTFAVNGFANRATTGTDYLFR